MLFSVFGASITLAVPMTTSETSFVQAETTHFIQASYVSNAARAPPLAMSNVDITGGVIVVQGSAFALHGQERVAAIFRFERSSIAPNRTAVDVSDVRRGTPEYEALNNPRPNTTTELSNGTTFRTGAGGYVDEVTYQPVNSSGVRDGRQTTVGREGIAGDVGGHIQACRHGGTCDRFNLFPQNLNFNNNAYRTVGK